MIDFVVTISQDEPPARTKIEYDLEYENIYFNKKYVYNQL